MMTGPHNQNIEVNPAIAGIKYAIRDIVLPAKELEKAGKKILYLNIGDPLAYDFKIPNHFLKAAYVLPVFVSVFVLNIKATFP